MRTRLLACCLLFPCCVLAQTPAADSTGGFAEKVKDSLVGDIKTPVKPKGLSWRPVVIPAAMVAYGVAELRFGLLQDVNIFGRKWASGTEDPDHRTKVDNYTMFVPAVALYGLNIGGIKGKNNLLDATMLLVSSSAVANALVFPVKNWTAVIRPDSSAPNSFPSGHTAQAFVCAEVLRQEYKERYPWISIAGYATGIATGYLRMYNNKHWFSDVVAGAGIGILSTRFCYYGYPKLKNLILGKHARTSTAMLMPTYGNGMVGLVYVKGF